MAPKPKSFAGKIIITNQTILFHSGFSKKIFSNEVLSLFIQSISMIIVKIKERIKRAIVDKFTNEEMDNHIFSINPTFPPNNESS